MNLRHHSNKWRPDEIKPTVPLVKINWENNYLFLFYFKFLQYKFFLFACCIGFKCFAFSLQIFHCEVTSRVQSAHICSTVHQSKGQTENLPEKYIRPSWLCLQKEITAVCSFQEKCKQTQCFRNFSIIHRTAVHFLCKQRYWLSKNYNVKIIISEVYASFVLQCTVSELWSNIANK